MTTYCGYVALVGRPNVGKSTLLNRLVHQKVSITSRKPQTTRHTIIGVHTDNDHQFVFVDTPGIHLGSKKIINRMMNKSAISTLRDVDAIVFLVDGTVWKEDDDYVLECIKRTSVPCFLAINKVDKITDKTCLLPWMNTIQSRHPFTALIPISAKTGVQVENLQTAIKAILPESPHFYQDDQLTDRPIRFLCAELVREKIFRLLGQELPYSTTVEIEGFKDEGELIRIHALIWVEKSSHKAMLIGGKGGKLKEIATSARLDMERLLEKKVFLQCFCKIKSGWSNDERFLKQQGFGY